jgi:hypothetical protein
MAELTSSNIKIEMKFKDTNKDTIMTINVLKRNIINFLLFIIEILT